MQLSMVLRNPNVHSDQGHLRSTNDDSPQSVAEDDILATVVSCRMHTTIPERQQPYKEPEPASETGCAVQMS